MKTIISVDPGDSGGLAVRWPSGQVKVIKMPDAIGGVHEVLRETLDLGPAVLYLEGVEGNAGGCRTAQQGFSFGQGFGHIEMACLCLGISLVKVKPQAWQKGLALGTVGTKRITKDATPEERKQIEAGNALLKRQWKTKLLEMAQQRCADQEFRVTLWNADALLILAYALEREIQSGV